MHSSREELLSAAPPNPKNFAHWPFRHENHNVVITWILCAVQSFADNIWSGTVLVAYIKKLTGGSNTYVGLVEAAQGMSTLIVALPVGYLADRFSKAKTVWIGGAFTPVAVGATAFAVIYGTEHAEHSTLCVYILMGAMCIWGFIAAVSNGPAQALYADSIAEGSRSEYYNTLFVVYLLSSVFGPILSIVLFAVYGNTWSLPDLRDILLVGLALEIPVGLLCCFYRDSCSLEPSPAQAGSCAGEGGDASAAEGGAASAAGTVVGEDQSEATSAVTPGTAPSEETKSSEEERKLEYRWLIPHLTFWSGLLFALGSGMTVKFFPLFFAEDCAMSPITVQIIYVLVPLVMAPFSSIATRVSRAFGRVPTMIVLKVVGVGMLVLMAELRDWVQEAAGTEAGSGDLRGDAISDGSGEMGSGSPSKRQADYYLATAVMAIIYLVRTGLMNCTYPLEESILMDFVPSDQRARWKALDSIASFGWCGSAALGGYLADQPSIGYTGTFLYTAAIQGAAVLLQASLMLIVPLHEKKEARPESADAAEGVAPSAGAVEPLLAAAPRSNDEGNGSAAPLPPRGRSPHGSSPGKDYFGSSDRRSAKGKEPESPSGSIN